MKRLASLSHSVIYPTFEISLYSIRLRSLDSIFWKRWGGTPVYF